MKCVSQVFRSAMKEVLASSMRQLVGPKITVLFHDQVESCCGSVPDKKMCDKKMQFIFLPSFFCLDCLPNASVLLKLTFASIPELCVAAGHRHKRTDRRVHATPITYRWTKYFQAFPFTFSKCPGPLAASIFWVKLGGRFGPFGWLAEVRRHWSFNVYDFTVTFNVHGECAFGLAEQVQYFPERQLYGRFALNLKYPITALQEIAVFESVRDRPYSQKVRSHVFRKNYVCERSDLDWYRFIIVKPEIYLLLRKIESHMDEAKNPQANLIAGPGNLDGNVFEDN